MTSCGGGYAVPERDVGRAMGDKAGEVYWERMWSQEELPRRAMPERDTLRNHSIHAFHRYFAQFLEQRRGQRLIEFGCAQSAWLPYFARAFGLAVTGIDQNARGCAKARAVLARDGAAGDVVEGDFFDPPPSLLGAFDVGVSFGVAEHFVDTAQCLAAFRRFLKPQGLLFTMIPNLAGILGLLQRHFDRKVYDVHVVLDAEALASAHQRAGFQLVDCRYIVSVNFGVLTLSKEGPVTGRPLKEAVRFGLMGLSAAGWLVDRRLLALPASRLFSPYIICAASNTP